MKPSQNSLTSKRAKPTENSSANPKKSPPRNESEAHQDEEEPDYIEAPPSVKVENIEQEESKQFLESNGNGNIVEGNSQDQGRFEEFCMRFFLVLRGL